VTIPTVSQTQDAPKASSPQNGPQMVQSLGLFSSTAIVVGSMIGSGIFLVDAEIGRTTNSPALFLGAWVITAIMTMICALSYGELAAMMPKAGGQYVYLRESLGPLCGFLYGWTLFLVIQTGTIAAIAVGFGKFLGVFFPSISSTHWLWHIAHVPPVQLGPMVLGNMEIGVSTANLVGIFVVFLLAFVNIFGVRLGSLIQNVFTTAKGLSLAALILVGFTIGRNGTAWAANFGDGLSAFWRNAGWSTLHPVQVGAGGPTVLVNLLVVLAVVLAVFCGCMEQHHVYCGRSEESKAEYPTFVGARYGVCADGVLAGVRGLLAGASAARRPARSDGAIAGHSVCGRGSRGHGDA